MNTRAPDDRAARELGRVCGNRPGPLLLAVAAIHGNEPAGISAARRVMARLAGMTALMRGDFVVLGGNLGALAGGRRFIERDLNRRWTGADVARLRERAGTRERAPAALGPEDREQLELLEAMEAAIGSARGEAIIVDLHTTSADGYPFAMIGDNVRNRRFALRFPMIVMLGLEELVDGPILEYWSDRGFTTFGVEGGQHQSPRAVENLENALWVALVAAGLLASGDVPDHEAHLAHLARSRGALPHVLEVLERHAITPADEFVMAPGFANVNRVRAGELLARDRRGEIRAGRSAVLFLPLYQAQGDDGFFLGREVPGAWLRLSAAARRIHLGPFVRLLPGVRRDPSAPRRLMVSARFKRWYPAALLNFFGFRMVRRAGPGYTIGRRRQ